MLFFKPRQSACRVDARALIDKYGASAHEKAKRLEQGLEWGQYRSAEHWRRVVNEVERLQTRSSMVWSWKVCLRTFAAWHGLIQARLSPKRTSRP